MTKIRNIAVIGANFAPLFLSSTPNFLVVERNASTPTHYEASITVTGANAVLIETGQGETYTFTPTTDADAVSGTVFFYDGADLQATANNLLNALRGIDALRSNFEIYTPVTGAVIKIKSLSTIPAFANLTITTSNSVSVANTATHSDSILETAQSAEIIVEVFEGAPETLGMPAQDDALGSYVFSLSKSYTGAGSCEFDLRSLAPRSFDFAKGVQGWQIPNNFVTRKLFIKFNRDGTNCVPFYVSPPVYILIGQNRKTDINLAQYLSGQFCNLLTSKPATYSSLQGSIEYFSFLYPNEFVGLDGFDFALEVCVSVQDTAGELIAKEYSKLKQGATLAGINTVGIDTAGVLEAYPEAGQLEIYLTRDRVRWSASRLIQVQQTDTPRQTVEFINEFGVLETFSFLAEHTQEYKTEENVFQKVAKLADTTTQRRVDVVAQKYISIVSAPVSDNVADWLQNLANSPAVWYNGKLTTSAEVSANTSDENRDFQTVNIKLTWEQ